MESKIPVTTSIQHPFPSRNDSAAKHDKLVGAKFQAVKCLLDLPEAAKDQILATVSLWGWEGFLPDEFLLIILNGGFCA